MVIDSSRRIWLNRVLKHRLKRRAFVFSQVTNDRNNLGDVHQTERQTMMHPEQGPCIIAIAGQTSTGKTRLGEGLVKYMEQAHKPDGEPFAACVFPVGDVFRLLTSHATLSLDDPEQVAQSVRDTLSQTHTKREPSGRIRLHYDGLIFEQTYHNGHSAGKLATCEPIVTIVNDYISTWMHTTSEDIIFKDCRERNGADILVSTTGEDMARIAARRLDQPLDTLLLTDAHILRDIHDRDGHELSLVEALQLEQEQVIRVHRTLVTPETDHRMVQQVGGVIMGAVMTGERFGTIYLQDT